MKILISSQSFGRIDSSAVDILKNHGLEPIINPYNRKLNEQEIIDLLDDAIGIIAGTEKITEKIISYNDKLKVISRYGIGLDNIDLKAAAQKNILVYNTPESPSLAVAELTLSLILNLLKKINKSDRNLKKNEWKQEIGNLLSGKTVGIIGLGRIGKQVVKFLKSFNTKMYAFDIKPDRNFVRKNKIELVPLDELIKKSDIITIHVPLTDKTRNIIAEKEFKIMKKNTVLINTARGGLVDEQVLYNALKNGVIAGAAFDVFENEPDTGRLKELDNIIITPHIGTYTFETRKHMEIEAANNLINGLKKMNVI